MIYLKQLKLPQMKNKTQLCIILSKYIKDPILDIINQTTAYSNYVYIIKTQKYTYIYKEYTNINNIVHHDMEVYIQTQIGFPTILFIEPRFRIERYVEHQTPNLNTHLAQIAEALYKFHNTKIDCNFTQDDLLTNMLNMNTNLKDDPIIIRIYRMAKAVVKCDIMHICHNDLQIGNMMEIDNKIRFIDFEYACMGNFMVDIANLFCETMCDYQKDFILKREQGYSIDQRRKFLQVYFKKINVEKELMEVEKCEVYSHFYWFLWSRYFYVSGNGPSVEFAYEKYSMSRLHALVEIDVITKDEYIYLLHKY